MRHRDRAPLAVLFDRDGTLVVDVPYNGSPERVQPMPRALEAVARLRAANVPLGVVSNQSGIRRGIVTPGQVVAVNARVDELFGGFAVWEVCPHAPADDCACRKPRPGLVIAAAKRLGLAPRDAAVVGDIGADVEAATAAGARSVLVPTPRTRLEEVRSAPAVAPDLDAAVSLLFPELPPLSGLGERERDLAHAASRRGAIAEAFA